MYKVLNVIVVSVIVLLSVSVFADEGDVTIGDVNLSGLTWGNQTANIELKNNTDLLKYVVTKTELQFEGMYTNPEYSAKTTYILEPQQSLKVSSEFFIPGNYGTATINLKVYDVIDTLDLLMPWQKIFEQPFVLKFNPSDEILPYFEERTTFPPRVDVHPLLNNEFVRLLFTLLAEKKSVAEIATMTNCDTTFVNSQINMFLNMGYLVPSDGSFKTKFPFISRKEAESARKIAMVVSDKLAAKLQENLGSYFTVIDSLATAKTIPNDSNDFISGATLLFKPTPVVSALVLWYELGKDFITRSAPLLLYDGTDICNAQNTQYMYMVDGGKYFNGSQFFGLFYAKDYYSIMFSEEPLQITCKDNFGHLAKHKKGVWEYDREILPEFFIIDTADARPLLNLMTTGCDEILKEAYDGLKKNSFDNGHDKVYLGHRYWMWNLIATLTLDKLYKNGTLEKRENGFYRFDKIKGFN